MQEDPTWSQNRPTEPGFYWVRFAETFPIASVAHAFDPVPNGFADLVQVQAGPLGLEVIYFGATEAQKLDQLLDENLWWSVRVDPPQGLPTRAQRDAERLREFKARKPTTGFDDLDDDIKF